MYMKKNFCFLFCLLLFAAACGNKENQKSESDLGSENVADTAHEIQKMRDYEYGADVVWDGTTYHYHITRKVEDSLDVVTDDTGSRYADNYIVLEVQRSGQSFFKQTFRKQRFTEFLNDDFRKHAILEGMAFDRVDEQGLRFSVSVSYPMSDMYIPLLITVTKEGTYTVQRDPVLDNVVESIDSLE